MMNRVLLGVVYVGLIACRGVAGDDGQTFGPTPTTPTETNATFLPAAFGITDAQFEYRDGLVYGLTANFLMVTDDGQSCAADWSAPGPLGRAPWSNDVGALLAFEIPADASFHSDCDEEDFPKLWGGRPSEHIARWPWGIAITTSPTTDTLDRLDPELRTNLDGYLLGGGVRFPNTSGDPWTPNAVAWETVEGEIQAIDAVLVDGNLVPGRIDLPPQTLLTPAAALLADDD